MKTTRLNSILCAVALIFGANGLYAQADDCGPAAENLPVDGACDNYANTEDGNEGNPGSSCHPGGGMNGSSDIWYTVTGTGNDIDITITGMSGQNAVLSVYSACPGAYGSDMDCIYITGATGLITISPSILGNTYFVRIQRRSNHPTRNGTGTICATTHVPPPTNTTCALPDPICSGTPILFQASATGTPASTVNPGNNYGCLTTSPSPSWFYLEIATGGDVAIDLTAAQDIDFAIWGPFIDLPDAISNCDSYGAPSDCSYSTSPTEQANVNGVVAGEVYVLLVTNYAAVVQNISVTEAPAMTATTNCSIVLPVELVNFEGTYSNDEVNLSWMTVSEKDNDYFIVEKSADGMVWTAFDMIDGAGNSQENIYYQSQDRKPFEHLTYYRIKQFDFNGKISLSDVIAVSSTATVNVQIFPNPAKDNVIINASERFSKIEIVDVRGLPMLSFDFNWISQTSLDVSSLGRGVYFTRLTTEEGITNHKIIIEK